MSEDKEVQSNNVVEMKEPFGNKIKRHFRKNAENYIGIGIGLAGGALFGYVLSREALIQNLKAELFMEKVNYASVSKYWENNPKLFPDFLDHQVETFKMTNGPEWIKSQLIQLAEILRSKGMSNAEIIKTLSIPAEYLDGMKVQFEAVAEA